MRLCIYLFLTFLLLSCSKNQSVYWCGDHACINKKEKEAYFQKTMIVEKREVIKQYREKKSELDLIKEQAGLTNKKKAKDIKISSSKTDSEEVLIQDEGKIESINRKLVKIRQERLEKKRLAKKKKKSFINKILKNENTGSELKKETISKTTVAQTYMRTKEFDELVERIIKKNMSRSYPDINKIPN